jgi:hypothetical protein
VLGAAAFKECSQLREATLSYGLQKIGGEAFALCTSLEKIEIPSSVKAIESHALNKCKLLMNVTLA